MRRVTFITKSPPLVRYELSKSVFCYMLSLKAVHVVLFHLKIKFFYVRVLSLNCLSAGAPGKIEEFCSPRPLSGRFRRNFTMEVGDCPTGASVEYLEHIQIVLTVKFSKRGDLKISLVGPSGTM